MPAAPAAKPAPSWQLAPLEQLTALDLSARLGGYAAHDAAWVPGQPIVVNRDFDFGTAMTLEGIGAGIAAAQRRTANEALARQLSSLPPLDVAALLRALCAQRPDGCGELSGATLRIYAQLYGERAARVRVFLELAGAEPPTRLYAAISGARPLQELTQEPALRGAFETELSHVLDVIALGAREPLATSGRCSAGDGAYVAGHVIERDAERVVLLAEEPSSLRVHCPAEAFSLSGT